LYHTSITKNGQNIHALSGTPMHDHSVGTAKDCESARYASLSFISFKKHG